MDAVIAAGGRRNMTRQASGFNAPAAGVGAWSAYNRPSVSRHPAPARRTNRPRSPDVAILWHFFKRFLRFRTPLLLGLLSIPLAIVGDVGVTLLIGDALERARHSNSTEWLPTVMLWLVVYALVQGVFRFYQRWLIVVVSRRVEVQLKQDLFDKLVDLPFAFHDKSRSGDVVSRLTSDVEAVRMVLGPGLMYTLGAVTIIPVSLVILFQLQPTLALVMVAPMFAMGLTMKLLSPRLEKYSTAVQESAADISHRAQENFAGVRIVQGYGREDQQAALFERTSELNRDNQNQLGASRGVTHAAINGSFDLTFAVILLIGGIAAIDRTMPVGNVFMFVDLTIKVFWPLIAIGWVLGMLPRARASAVRIDELLREVNPITDPATDVPAPLAPADVRGHITFEDVSFTYPRGTGPALSHVSFDVPAGATLGIVGPTGAGKSTILNLVGRLIEATSGRILLDGVPLRDLPLSTVRNALGYVPQDSFLFSERYEDNIRFGADRELSDAEVDTLIERAAMTDEVARFPEGKRTLVGERGVTLSGGQRQRTCIARALARDPKVLVLDDCLSAVDTETERHLLASLSAAGEGRTVLVSAHRLSTVRDADRILVLSARGVPEALGTHSELLEAGGWYRETWERQQRRETLREQVSEVIGADAAAQLEAQLLESSRSGGQP
jgi:ATP-binding cassette subfamily B multidrug efflux pump